MAGHPTPEGSPAALDHNIARELRGNARQMFLSALAETSIQKAFDRHIGFEKGVLRVGDDLYDISSFSRILVISIGKAAHTMVECLMTTMGGGTGATGIVAGSTDPAAQVFGFRYYRGGHPVPNEESVRAADAMVRSVTGLSTRSLVIYMISGGGSSIVERPIDPEISLTDLVSTYKALVLSGAPIADINAVRKHLSAIKGGRLARAAAPAHQLSILVSDVPENSLDALASGPTMPDATTVEQCHAVVKKYKLLKQFPASVRELFERNAIEETPKRGDMAFERSRWWTILSNTSAQKALIAQAALHGFAVDVDNSCDDWDYVDAGDHLLKRLRELRRGVSRACIISGGEVTVKVEGDAGIGGRNQQFALYCATEIAGENIVVLSAGTDGIDGNSPAAGAIADGTTVERAREKGLSAEAALKKFDAYPLFDALGDAIMTGPTGNNVRDLRLLLAY